MFGFFGYSASVSGALYEIGITSVPPHRIDQYTKTVICEAQAGCLPNPLCQL